MCGDGGPVVTFRERGRSNLGRPPPPSFHTPAPIFPKALPVPVRPRRKPGPTYDYMTLDRAAKVLGIDYSGVHQMIRDGDLKARPIRGQLFVSIRSVNQVERAFWNTGRIPLPPPTPS